MLSQFSKNGDTPILKDLPFNFPDDVYPVGRLDADSEGLLLLTNDKSLTDRLLNPKNLHKRTYLIQVDGDITDKAVIVLSQGLTISINGKKHKTAPASAFKLHGIPDLPERNPPVRFRKNIPTSWIKLTLTEGKNRQVRRMTAAAGFPTIRLIRVAIEGIELGNMQPGDVLEINSTQLKTLIFNK